MAATELKVYLDGTFAGVITQSNAERIDFRYDEEYRHNDDAVPLSLSMPLTIAGHSPRVIQAFLWGLLPDRPETLERWVASSRSPPTTRSGCSATWERTRQVRYKSCHRGRHRAMEPRRRPVQSGPVPIAGGTMGSAPGFDPDDPHPQTFNSRLPASRDQRASDHAGRPYARAVCRGIRTRRTARFRAGLHRSPI